MDILRRNYQDSYLTEIGQPGTNGRPVHRILNGSRRILSRAKFVAILSWPAYSFTASFPYIHHRSEANGGNELLHTMATVSVAAGRAELQARTGNRYENDLSRDASDCSYPIRPTFYFGGSISGSLNIDFEFSDGREAAQFRFDHLYKPFWGTLAGDRPSSEWGYWSDNVQEEGEWGAIGTYRMSFATPIDPDSGYSNSCIIDAPWIYSTTSQHRIGNGMTLGFAKSEFRPSDPESGVRGAMKTDLCNLWKANLAGFFISLTQSGATYA